MPARKTDSCPPLPRPQCPLAGFPLDYSYKEVRTIAGFLDDDPYTGVAKGMDRSSLPKGAEVNATGVRLANNRLESLDGLADFAAEAGLWFHVDGAFGAALVSSSSDSERYASSTT